MAALRERVRSQGLDGYLLPRRDEHMSEFLPPSAERLAWLTGFTGSAGTVLVLSDRSFLFVDGRYTVQAARETDPGLFTVVATGVAPFHESLRERLPFGGRIGFDPWIHAESELERIGGAADKAGASLVPVDGNLVDAVWHDRPPQPRGTIVVHEARFAGREPGEKQDAVAASLREAGVNAALLVAPESVNWLLNIRGADVPYTPVLLAMALLYDDGEVDLFVAPDRIDDAVRAHLGPRVGIRPREDLVPALDELGTSRSKVRIERSGTPVWLLERVRRNGCEVDLGDDPCVLPKSCKNPTEVAGIKSAHVRDGAALTRFLAWLDQTAPGGGVDELSAAAKLLEFRQADPLFQGPSFPTIAGFGANGAVVHYRPGPETNLALVQGGLFLVDSGGQYPDGTTDVTRTVAIGEPPEEARLRFTQVLKGHIALASARFPQGTGGGQLDALARLPLWREGLDYDHGTGHGVGHFLGVHEGPQRISKVSGGVPLQPGMVVSIEPGFYKEGEYGIRIENLAVVEPAAPLLGGRPMLAFEPLTLAPIDTRLIDTRLLDAQERAWVEGYHARVRDALRPLLDAATYSWLEDATRLRT